MSSYDITQYALNEYAKGNIEISLNISQNQRASGGAGTVNLASKEKLDSNLRPTLTVLQLKVNTTVENMVDESTAIFPFITHEWVSVRSNLTAPLEIRNINGVLLKKLTLTLPEQKISLLDLPSGVFLMSVQNRTFKVVKI